jgi:hypothetical protein
MGYDLEQDHQTELIERQLTQLRVDRAQAQLDYKRWSAIPEELRDGTEQAAIERAQRVIAIAEAQIDALS